MHDNELLFNFISSKQYNSIEKFKNALLINKVLLPQLLGFEQSKDGDTDRTANELRKKLNGIKDFSPERLHEAQPDFQIRLRNDGTEDFKAFLIYYVYLKKRVRNYLNHASEGDELPAEFIPVFQSYGIITDQLTPDNIKENIHSALMHLNQCIPNEK